MLNSDLPSVGLRVFSFCQKIKGHYSQESKVIKTGISNHFGQVLNIFQNLTHSNSTDQFEYKRVFSCRNYEKLYELLEREGWFKVCEASSVDDQYNCFIYNLCKYFDLAFPLKKVKTQNITQPRWISENIQNIKDNLNLFSELLQSKQITKAFFNDYKKYYTQTLLQEKRIFYKTKITKSDNKSKTIWNIIKTENGKIDNNINH